MFQTQKPAFAFPWFELPNYTVFIRNAFNNNDDPLVMHCWSHDDDLGVHTLWMDNVWHWKFGNKILLRTHFVCNMKHGNKEKTIDVYDTYNNELNKELRCDGSMFCRWIVRDDGFYFFSEKRLNIIKIYDW